MLRQDFCSRCFSNCHHPGGLFLFVHMFIILSKAKIKKARIISSSSWLLGLWAAISDYPGLQSFIVLWIHALFLSISLYLYYKKAACLCQGSIEKQGKTGVNSCQKFMEILQFFLLTNYTFDPFHSSALPLFGHTRIKLHSCCRVFVP